MLDLAKEFGFKVAAFHHGVEAYKLADRLAAEGVCGALWADWWGFKMEAFDGIQENIALVDRPANSCAIVHSDSDEGIQRLNQEAAKVIAHARLAGMDIAPERAIRWLTQNPAKALGILDQTGTLEPGKMADVVVWNGNPFSVYAHAEQVYIDGARVYDRNDRNAPAGVGLHARPGCCGAGRCAVRTIPRAPARHSGESRNPVTCLHRRQVQGKWIPAFAGMTVGVAGGRLLLRVSASAQDLLIRNATVHTATAQGTLQNADVLVSGGTIRAVGTGLPAPASAQRHRRAGSSR